MTDESTDPTFEQRALQDAFAEFQQEARRVARRAPFGAVVNDLEGFVLEGGREILRKLMENELQAAAERAEKKGARPRRTAPLPSSAPSAKRRRGTRGGASGNS